MGIYSDIQKDVKEAMDEDLADAVATLTVTETESSTVYNPSVGGGVTNTPVINSMQCIIIGPDDSEESGPDSDTATSDLEVMVLDSLRTAELKIGLLATIRGINYKVLSVKVDPAGATHTMELRIQ